MMNALAMESPPRWTFSHDLNASVHLFVQRSVQRPSFRLAVSSRPYQDSGIVKETSNSLSLLFD